MRVFHVLIILIALGIIQSCKSKVPEGHFKVKRGDFKATIIESGELQAVNAKAILMPFIGWRYGWRFKITGLVDHGSVVKENDSVAQIDESGVVNFLLESENNLKIQKTNFNKLLLDQLNKTQQLESELIASRANYDLIKLQREKFKFEPERKKQIKDLEFQRATINYEKTQKKYKLEKAISEIEIKVQRIRIKQLENRIIEAEEALKKLTIRSPGDGILQHRQHRRSRQFIKIGDDIHQGNMIASVPDLSQMSVLSSVNEVDIQKVHEGQKVIVRLDAFPSIPYNATITRVGKICYPKDDDESNVKVFELEILIDEQDQALKPGMTVSCEMVISEEKYALYIENECIVEENGQDYLYKLDGGEIQKTAVEIISRNNKYSMISGDIEKDDIVLGSEMVKQL